MALFKNIYLTEAGQELLNNRITGETTDPLSITSIAIGDGVAPADTRSITALVHEVRRLAVETGTTSAGVLRVTARLSTDQISENIVHRELGLYSGDTLFAYCNAGDDYDFIPATGQSTAVIKMIACNLYIGDVDVVIETYKSPDYVTFEALEQRVREPLREAVDLTKAAADSAAKSAASASESSAQAQRSEQQASSSANTATSAASNATQAASNAANSAESVNRAVDLMTAGDLETPDGDESLNCYWIHFVSPKKGSIEAIDMACRPASRDDVSTTPAYLGIWEQDENSNTYSKIGESVNTATFSAGGWYRWRFDNLKLTGRPLRLMPLSEPERLWDDPGGLILGLSVSKSSDGYATCPAGKLSYIPHMIMGYSAPLDSAVRSAAASAEMASTAAEAAQRAAALVGSVADEAKRAADSAASAQAAAESVATNAAEAKTAAEQARASVERLSTVMTYRGSVSTYDDLPADDTLSIGDFYNVIDTDANYAWTGKEWDLVGSGVNLDGLATKDEVQAVQATASTAAQNALAANTNVQKAMNAAMQNLCFHHRDQFEALASQMVEQGDQYFPEARHVTMSEKNKWNDAAFAVQFSGIGDSGNIVIIGRAARTVNIGWDASAQPGGVAIGCEAMALDGETVLSASVKTAEIAEAVFGVLSPWSNKAKDHLGGKPGIFFGKTGEEVYISFDALKEKLTNSGNVDVGCVAVGYNSSSTLGESVAIGNNAQARGDAIAVGGWAYASVDGVAIGGHAEDYGTAVGSGTWAEKGAFALGGGGFAKKGTGILSVYYKPDNPQGSNSDYFTFICLVGKDSPTAAEHTDGEAGLLYRARGEAERYIKLRKLFDIVESADEILALINK